MTKVTPFRGISYNSGKVSGGDVIAPPYDIISPALKDKLYSMSPYNIVRVDFGRDIDGDDEDENRYSRAAGNLEEWLKEGVLVRSAKPSFYAYRMDYTLGGRSLSLTGFFGIVKLVELGEGVYPHEETHSKPKNDRLTLMRVSQANTSPIFSVYTSPARGASKVLEAAIKAKPSLTARDLDGAVHSFWPLQDEDAVEAIRADLEGKDIFIADGHHRYETALDYQHLMRQKHPGTGTEAPYDYVLMFLANTCDTGLTALPTHRLIHVSPKEDLIGALGENFEVEKLPPGIDIIEAIAGREQTFGLYWSGELYRLAYRGGGNLDGIPRAKRGIDVVVLHELVFDRLLQMGSWGYEMDPARAMRMVDDGRYNAAFFLNPTSIEEVQRVALAGERMPPKCTYFYPKISTGFVMNNLKSF